MLGNGLKILLRTIQKRFLIFGINILGLSIGISCVLFIAVYSIEELSFDKHFANHERIYRVVTEYPTNSSSDGSMAESFLGVAPTLKREFAEVEEAVRVFPYNGIITIQYKSGNVKNFDAENTYRVDKEFFRVFRHHFIYGNESSLTKPNSIVVTKSLAKKLFGESAPINKAVLIDNQTYGVTGVIEDLPENSDLYYEALLAHDFSAYDDDWGNPAGFTYVLLNDSQNSSRLEARINEVASQKALAFFVKEFEMKSNIKISLQSLSTIHFAKPLSGDNLKGNPAYLKVLITLGVIILTIIIFNYSNFSTSLYMERIHELSVRKLMGISKKQLIQQIVFESGILASMALVISIILFITFLPVINLVVGKNFSFLNLLDSTVIVALVTIFLLVVIANNFYPIFYSFKNSIIGGLRGFSNVRNNGLRKALITGQLLFTTVLVFFTITVHDQLNFLKNKDLGFDSNNVIMISLDKEISRGTQLKVFIDDLRRNRSIKEISLINEQSHPGSDRVDYQLGWIYNRGNRIEGSFNLYEVDSVFTKLLDMNFLAGGSFSTTTAGLAQQAIVNQAFIKMAGFANPYNVIGETIHAFDTKLKIIGVVNDFNYQDFRQSVRPLVMIPIDQASLGQKRILIDVNHVDALKMIERSYQKLVPNNSFEYAFLDERVQRMFAQEQTTGRIAELFSLLAIVLAGIGLYTLSSLILIQRTKEIGIRKILGITQTALIRLLSNEFFVLFLVSFVVSVPIAWTHSQSWLAGYAFKTDLSIVTIGLTGLIILTILVIGILTNVLRSIRINPVDLIRND